MWKTNAKVECFVKRKLYYNYYNPKKSDIKTQLTIIYVKDVTYVFPPCNFKHYKYWRLSYRNDYLFRLKDSDGTIILPLRVFITFSTI